MAEHSEEFLRETIRVWQPFYSAPLSMEDAREIANNIANLLSLLVSLDTKYGEKAKI
jgi:hypothetical protein